MELTKRNFTMTEQLDLEAAPGVWVEDDYAANGADDRLYATGDNEYTVVMAEGKILRYGALQEAIQVLVFGRSQPSVEDTRTEDDWREEH